MTEAFLTAQDVVPDHELASAEDDLFGHDAIAGRLAELVTRSPDPVHVGVFGTWGSGKSSFLRLLKSRINELEEGVLQRRLRMKRRFKIVRYDAWRFSGTALRRDFIAVAARQLRLTGSTYSSGLFESRQVVKLDFDELLHRLFEFAKGILALALGLFGAGALLLSALWAVGLALPELPAASDIWMTLKPYSARILAVTGAVIAALNLPRLVGVSVSRSSPSQDDEFTELLAKLILQAELPRFLRMARLHQPLGTWIRDRVGHRVVFFIDELDRASSEELVATLTALQTMLTTVNVSAVLAVDRAVVEHALFEHPHQAGPTRALDPYLTTHDAFLDKVFQHQFHLPPLRHERVQNYAKALVHERGGLWKQLLNDGVLDDVVYVLVPSHVRNPRRIKVLLNSFATQYRVAQARGLPVDTTPLELAKWVVLQLEFPDFAQDVVHEPRLQTLLAQGVGSPGLQARLIERHGLRPQPGPGADDGAWKLFVESTQLHRYLERTAHVPDLTRSLLYVELAGSAVGRFDAEVARALDEAGDRESTLTLASLGVLSDEERDAAIQFLAERSRSAISEGSDRIVSVLTSLVESYSDKPISPLAPALESLRAYRFEPSSRVLPQQAWLGSIRILSEAHEDEWLTRAINAAKADAALSQQIQVRLALPNSNSDLQRLVKSLIAHIDEPTVAAIIGSENWAMARAMATAAPDALLTALIESVGDESLSQADLLFRHLETEHLTSLTGALAGALRETKTTPPLLAVLRDSPTIAPASRSLVAMAAIPLATQSEVEQWATFITEATSLPAPVVEALVTRIWTAENSEAIWGEVARLCGLGLDDDLTAAVTASFSSQPYPATGDAVDRAVLAVRAASLVKDFDQDVSDQFVVSEAHLAIGPMLRGQLAFSDAEPLIERASVFDSKGLDQEFVRSSEGQPPTVVARAFAARLRLRGMVRGLPVVSAKLAGEAYAAERAVASRFTATNQVLASAFFSSNPSDRGVIAFMNACSVYFPNHLADWGRGHTSVQVTNLWIALLDNDFSAKAGASVSMHTTLNVPKAAKLLNERMSSKGSEARKEAAAFVAALPAGRTDSSSLVQTVAIALATAGGDERIEAVKLLSNSPPRMLRADTRAVMVQIPRSMWRRKSDRAMARRVGVRFPKRRSLRRG